MRFGSTALATAVVMTLVACGGDDAGSRSGPLTVMAAASLTEAFTEIGARFEDDNPGTVVRLNFGSSSELAVQIVEGAPADIFASADEVQMGIVAEADGVEDSRIFATNSLVVVVPRDNPANIADVTDLARAGVKLVLASPEVPAGGYARDAFAALGIEEEVEANVVSNERDVKQVLARVSLGEADAGVVYVTDVTDRVDDQVTVIEFPTRARIVATYPIATLSDAPNPDAAKLFYDFVVSPTGQTILAEYGFHSP